MALTYFDYILAFGATLCACCYFYIQHYGRHLAKLPPCPFRRLPIIGNILSLEENPRIQFKTLHKQFGDFFSVYFGNTLVVVVNGYQAIREILVKKGAYFSHRPPMFFNECIGLDVKGIAFSSGPEWREIRSVTLQIFRELGLSNNSIVNRIEEEVDCYVDKLLELKGQASDIQNVTNISVSNVICYVIFGRRFCHSDLSFQKVVENVDKLLASAAGAQSVNFFPFLKHVPGDVFKVNTIKTHMTAINAFILHHLSEIRKDEKRESQVHDPHNFISLYLEIQKERINAGYETYLDTDNLIKTILDIFIAGTETTSSTILWCLIYVLNYPQVQDKIHEELDNVVGWNIRPTLEAKAKLPYLNAVIMETQRLSSLVPFSLMHETSEEVTLRNFVIPKGTKVIPNLDSVHHDPDIWGPEVYSFNPNRFLKADGSGRHREELIPFSVGPRVCVGENLAKYELFLFLSAIFQRFKFQAVDPTTPPSTKEKFGITAVPAKFKVKCIDRFKEYREE